MSDALEPRGDAHGTIVVSGTGRVSVEPDLADLRLGVSVARPTVQSARSVAAATMDAILAAVTAAGVKRRDVRTTLLSVQPRYDHRENQPPALDEGGATPPPMPLMKADRMMAATDTATPVEAGSMEIAVTVVVTYRAR